MLELRDITKIYPAGGDDVEALRGISLRLRRNEFVAILGPSGCGKTTLLNIVGGLDQYTSGDLIINGRSTKDFRDRDWDAYRNHSIGFVFQSYNLIPHQTVLQNVELALTLSGVSRQERRRRAKEALEKVGLGDQLRKKPAEMSGGQMQRVAIARAIVNDPDIILADEPTGALDTETSVQVMDILKEIAGDRLVIMVTHNPELAERYATRIIRMLDGRITDDACPMTDAEAHEEAKADEQRRREKASQKLPSMSLLTSFGLSLKNLFTKKGRTVLTSFAGSIGIIGIALIYAVSHGMTGYISTVQEETLSSYPLTLEARHTDLSSLVQSFAGQRSSRVEHPDDGLYQRTGIYEMVNALASVDERQNDLGAFKTHLDAVRADPASENPLKTAVSGVQYTYDIDLQVCTKNVDGQIIVSDPQAAMRDLMSSMFSMDMSSMSSMQQSSSMFSSSAVTSRSSLWREMLPGEDGAVLSPLFEKQYDLLWGRWPSRYDEVVIIADEDGEMSDIMLYALGLIPREEVEALMAASMNREAIEYEARHWSWEELGGLDFRVIQKGDRYVADSATGLYSDLQASKAGMQYLYDNALRLRVVGVIRPAEDALATMITSGVGYTSLLTEHLMESGRQSAAVQAQLASPGTDILTGLPFPDEGRLTEEEKAAAFRRYLKELGSEEKAACYIRIKSTPDEETIASLVAQQMAGLDRSKIEAMMTGSIAEQMGVDSTMVTAYLAGRTDEELFSLVEQMLTRQIRSQYAEQAAAQLQRVPAAQLAMLLQMESQGYTDAQCAAYYDSVLTFSSSTLAQNLSAMGWVDPDRPSGISLYASTFAGKDEIERAITDYNEDVDELARISYTDYVGLMMSSVTTIIDAITYVLIAFVAISLIVSSIMIGVITLISVQERTKEIGILRAIGASKRNVSSMFNAETVIIGFTSGALGIGVTYLLCIVINLILHRLTGLNNLNAVLDIRTALILVGISMLLTLIAGIIPSRSAARKDPVVALRTE